MANYLIITDLEGISGVQTFKEMKKGNSTNLLARGILTSYVNAAIRGLSKRHKDRGKNPSIHVWDGHGGGGIIQSRLTKSESVFYHPPGWFDINNILKEKKIVGLLFIGQHAMSNTPRANLCHTFSSNFVDYYSIISSQNGKKIEERIGEIGFRAALAAEVGVPTIFLVGDDKAVEEAESKIPNITTVVTKTGVSLERAISRPNVQVCLEIEEGVEAAVKKNLENKVGFYSLSPPLELHISSRNFLGLISNLSKGAIWEKKRLTVFKTKCMYDLEILRKGKATPNNLTERLLRELRKTYLSIISNFS